MSYHAFLNRRPALGLRSRAAVAWVLVLAGLSIAAAREYQAPVADSIWRTDGSPLGCHLAHPIPGFGEAVFVRQAGSDRPFNLHFHVSRGPRQDTAAHLVAVPPPWQHGAEEQVLGRVVMHTGHTPLYLEGDLARRMLEALQAGMLATVSFPDWGGSGAQIRVALSPINFRSALERFQACEQDLLPVTFADIAQSVLHFALDSAVPTVVDEQRLAHIAAYMRADPRVRRVRITGHADNVGTRRYNRGLSKRRAEAIRDYLTARGVIAERVDVRFYGERKPVASNRAEDGRRQNRRAEVVLLR